MECSREEYRKMQENRPKPHKHANLIRAWADGAKVQLWSRSNERWEDVRTPFWDDETLYRIKPKTIRYRTYLWLDPYSNTKHIGVEEGSPSVSRDKRNNFVCWLGDWQEVEV